MEKVISVNHLKELAIRDNGEFVKFDLLLAGGLLTSVKRISYRPNEEKRWLICNEITDTYEQLSEKDFSQNSLLVQAIDMGTLFLAGNS